MLQLKITAHGERLEEIFRTHKSLKDTGSIYEGNPQAVELSKFPEVMKDMSYLIGLTFSPFEDWRLGQVDKK